MQAVTVSGTGEVHCAAGVRNALAVLDAIGRADIPVACGRETPLAGTHAFPDVWRANADNVYGVELPPSASQASALSASELLAGDHSGFERQTGGADPGSVDQPGRCPTDRSDARE